MHASRAMAVLRAGWKISRAQKIAAAAATTGGEAGAGADDVFEAADDDSETQLHFQAVQGAPVATSHLLDSCCALIDALLQIVTHISSLASALYLALHITQLKACSAY